MVTPPAATERTHAARAELIACETCGGPAPEVGGRTQGELLLAALRAELARLGDERLQVSSVRCLWACQQSCAVHLRAEGRAGYVIVRLSPTEEAARALLAYGALYLDSADGRVPYKSWPPELKGHFLCRIPCAPAALAGGPAAPATAEKDPS